MTDRGLPIVDGAAACPFVAFEDDREERASSPDQRHRCYAEVRPAPRAQAHQDAYCLSSAFPMCPTFQEWARREAARIHEAPPPDSVFTELPPRRNPNRGWAAPPPWTGAKPARTDDADDPDFLATPGLVDAGLAGSLAHRIALDGAPPAGKAPPGPLDGLPPSPRQAPRQRPPEPNARSVGTAGPSVDAWPLEPAPRIESPDHDPRDHDPRDRPSAPNGGEAAQAVERPDLDDEAIDAELGPRAIPSDIARWARPEDRGTAGRFDSPRAGVAAAAAGAAAMGNGAPVAARGARGAGTAGPASGAYDPDDEADDVNEDLERHERGYVPPSSGRPPQQGGLGRVTNLLPGDHRPKVGDTRPRRRTGDVGAPPWERPRRYEAYPTIRTRIGLPAMPRVGLLAIALLLAAVGLFFLPTLLGVGSPAGSPAPSGTPARSGAPSASPGPSALAVPTPQVYEVQPGDTMSKIAAKFGVPLADLVAANKDTIPNPDKLAIGDMVVIPAPPPSGFTDPRTAAPAASPTQPPATRTPTPTRR